MIRFPGDFFWGAATSSYQVEGGNSNADWWEWEKKVSLKDKSGECCRHYELYASDFQLAKQLGHNAHRLSIEWSRIEPEEGVFNEKELDHYRKVISSLAENGIEPIVTLHHFTNPLWFSRLGGWQSRKSVSYFLRYAQKVVEALSDKVRFWVTVNEPVVYAYHAYMLGVWPPQQRSFLKANSVLNNFLDSHVECYNLIKSIYLNKNLALPSISIAHNLLAFVPCGNSLKNKFAAFLRDRIYNFGFIEKMIRCNSLDYIGINYYARILVDVRKWGFSNFLMDVCQENHYPLKKNSMGWDIYPEGIYKVLLKLKDYNLPVFILENGICTEDDSERWEYIYLHLRNIRAAMDKGVRVLGYIYWSLMDNFEWDKGFGQRFGLIEIDYHTYKRMPRESAKRFSRVCKSGELE